MNLKLFPILLVLIFSVNSYAKDLPEWFYQSIKVKDPDQLAYFLETSQACPFTKDSLHKIVDGVLIRSRLKPLKEDIFVHNRIYLNLIVNCVPLKSGNPVFSIRTNFARFQPFPAIIIDNEFGTTGIGPEDFIKQAFKESVENAVTAHIKANFDL
ncbi:hypothetical protein CWN98_17230 [Vibrio splendidus]|uniref:hypothetical protein n=1 Tax=Vibrio splendidus TaxID=29497 RepID=UPI000D365B80|nr:hypothetical protein [Vibrio splendidus]PTO84334.1 hypothetical protein CWN98_17230 [Vibrio splendidus]PTP45353.1 hypothetical protein CWO10_16945 [Vibrio splendidus]